jgi:hypothetical protein
MPAQTTLSKLVYPDGLHFGVSDDAGASFADVGVMGGSVEFTLNGDVTQLFTSNSERTDKTWRNMSMTVAPGEMYSWDSEAIETLLGGVFTRTAVAGTPVSGATQILQPGYVYEKIYPFEGQQATGVVPTAISLGQETTVGSGVYTDALVLNTDYVIKRDSNGEWGFALIDTATVDNTLGVKATYTYTPATGAYLKAGTSSQLLTDVVVRFRHYTDTDAGTYDFEVYLYRVTADPGSFVMTKKGANDDGVDVWTIGLTADVDSSRTDGDQLVSIFLGNS